MFLMAIALLVTALKYFEVGAFGRLEWLWVVGLYVATAAWWAWADWSGYTKRRAAAKMDKHKQDRLKRQRDQLGLNSNKKTRR
jgi:small Trp-rich protein